MAENIENGASDAYSNYQFLTCGATRLQRLDSVMPINNEFSYAAILNDAYLRMNHHDTHVLSFFDLCKSMNERFVLTALVKARNNGLLTEGRKCLPDSIANYLSECGGEYIYAKYENNKKIFYRHIDVQQLKTDIFDALEIYAGEFEIFDSNGSWYLRFRDDDSIMFFAARHDVVSELTKKFPNNCISVQPDFIYSR